MSLVNVGYITGAFGIKGEVKVQNSSNHEDLIYKENNTFYIDEKPYEISKIREYKGNYLVTFKGYEDINKTENFWKKDVYIERNNLNLKENDFLYEELLGLNIVFENKIIGTVKELLLSKKDIFIKDGSLIIPLIDKYFENVNLKKKEIYVKNAKELML